MEQLWPVKAPAHSNSAGVALDRHRNGQRRAGRDRKYRRPPEGREGGNLVHAAYQPSGPSVEAEGYDEEPIDHENALVEEYDDNAYEGGAAPDAVGPDADYDEWCEVGPQEDFGDAEEEGGFHNADRPYWRARGHRKAFAALHQRTRLDRPADYGMHRKIFQRM